MPPPKPPPDDDGDGEPVTPRRDPAVVAARRRTLTTPREYVGGQTPKSAPAAAAAAGPGQRRRASSQRPQPTLLGDFFLGKQSPARVAASRRKSLDATAQVRSELREMRRSSVQRLQPPGGVRDRVKAWQKANASAMVKGDPEATPTEPTEVGAQIDTRSVTEEDRVRIKMRKKPKRRSARRDAQPSEPGTDGEGVDAAAAAAEGEEEEEEDVDEDDDDGVYEEVAVNPKLRAPPPKKRIVSDEHWMKTRRRASPKTGTPKSKPEGSPAPIPKDFLQRTAVNPTVQSKIKDWATRVEPPETPPKVKRYSTKSGITVTIEEDGASSARSAPDDGIRVRPIRSSRSAGGTDDGIRVKPVRRKEPTDDGIRVAPIATTLPDDGIRVRPSRKQSMDELTVRASSRATSRDVTTRKSSSRREPSPSERIEVIEEPESLVDTPTRRSRSQRTSRLVASERTASAAETRTRADDATETKSQSGGSDASSKDDRSFTGSYQPSSAPAKSLADIPFGYSAFSELDLPSKRPKTQRNPSFKAVPMVLKKVVSGGKKILHDKVDPPKPVVNQPPSIESWLDNTVDPFVETPASPKAETPVANKRRSIEDEWKQDARKRSVSENRQREAAKKKESPASKEPTEQQEEDEGAREPHAPADGDETPKKEQPAATPKASGLKRRSATRNVASPLKSGGKKPFREVLKEAFRGESGGHKLPLMTNPPTYPDEHEAERDSELDDSEVGNARRRSSGGAKKRSPSPEPTASSVDSTVESSATSTTDYPRRRPPTNGMHELSTIVSMESFSTGASDTLSTVSQTTITQTTATTKETDLSRTKSQKSGLKRRLTKHSDLVSVLSLPGDAQLPARAKSIKVARSLHRKTSKLENASLDDLMREFAEDENLYQRELKTLVDGVVPVLLTQVVHGGDHRATDLFGQETSNQKADTMSKAVVSMGIALEKLKNFHKRVPFHDASRLLTWLENVHAVYDNYLDVWRLGFQDIVVNLAPASGRPDDEDSLINAMTRDENGDVLDENGERVDVAHLLKRPLVRIKWLYKLVKGAHKCLGEKVDYWKVDMWDSLHKKAQRRHREELARKTDEDANNTDTTRTRDLRNLAALDNVAIDQTRQVNAMDVFSLDLGHSNGQRLECQVELVFRDKPEDPTDAGDILIREHGSRGRSWLLFPPVLLVDISARRGEGSRGLVAMIRGVHEGEEWYQLLHLVAEHEDSVAEWLDLLGTSPIPPSANSTALTITNYSAPSPSAAEFDIPVGERKADKQPASPYNRMSFSPSPTFEPPKAPTPSRYHQRNLSVPSTPTPASSSKPRSPSLSQTPTQSTYLKNSRHPLPQVPPEPSSRPLREDMRPDPAKLVRAAPNTTPIREDGAPPPPVHRTLGSGRSPQINPPVELSSSGRVKRRTSSPLKHEYHPSDASSDDSTSESSGSESDSSGDELEEDDVPDTLPAISIKKPEMSTAGSVISECSLTPSNSASQAGVMSQLRGSTPEYVLKFVASISYWSNKRGTWKALGEQACSIVITPGLIEAHPLNASHSAAAAHGSDPLQSSGTSSDPARGGGGEDADAGAIRPLIALDLTPLVMIRQSTVIDLEIRSPVRTYSRYNKIDGSIFRFRALSPSESTNLYMAVHRSRMNNAKFRALEEEARFRSFGQPQSGGADGGGNGGGSGGGGDDSSSRRRRGWFGRKSSYRASTRAPSQSQGSSSSVSASSFLKRLTGGGNLSFNIDRSSVDKQSRAGSSSAGGGGGGGSGRGVGSHGAASLYTSGSSSYGGSGSTPPRSPSVSMAESGVSRGVRQAAAAPGSDNLRIRCHLQISPSKWEDHGNCLLTIARPPPGVRQELAIYHGMEKRVIVTSIPKREGEKAVVVLDVVVGSGCFSRLAARGIVLNVWEDLRDENNNVGAVPRAGGVSGKVKKWCFQCSSTAEATWIHGLVAQEVMIA